MSGIQGTTTQFLPINVISLASTQALSSVQNIVPNQLAVINNGSIYQYDRNSVAAPSDPSVIDTFNSVGRWLLRNPGGEATDVLVAVSGTDTTPGYLLAKLAEGGHVTLSVDDPAGDEKVNIAVSISGNADGDLSMNEFVFTLFGFLGVSVDLGTQSTDVTCTNVPYQYVTITGNAAVTFPASVSDRVLNGQLEITNGAGAGPHVPTFTGATLVGNSIDWAAQADTTVSQLGWQRTNTGILTYWLIAEGV